MSKVWKMKPVEARLVGRLADELSVPPIIARLLIHRGAASRREASDFLCADLSLLPPPELMADLKKAVSLIRRAASRGERILLVGDYDADGLTGTALLYRVIRQMGGRVTWHIPHRINDGYGLKPQRIRAAASSLVKLLITVDCGTTSFEELQFARRLGIQTVVVDHHELLPAGRPPASAFLNPLQPDCRYPTKELASVGVAFTLARGLLGRAEGNSLWDHLDLVALGTVADLAPLNGENRILVKAGLHRLQGSRKVGLRALLNRARLDGDRLTSEDVSFTLGPRLNAMGRLGSAQMSFRLLITEDPQEGKFLAKEMEEQNKARGRLEREAFRRALLKVEREVNFARDRVIVLEDQRWHPGVVGIIATRLAQRFHRPAVVIAVDGKVGRGSARSIRGFSLMEALEEVKEHLKEFGGHPGAAGLSLCREKIPSFREALNHVAHDRMDPRELEPSLELEGELPLSSLTEDLLRDLELLAPFGQGNSRPVFVARDSRLKGPPRGGYREIRFLVEGPEGRLFEAIHPRLEGWDAPYLREGPIELAYFPVRCRTGESSRIQLKLRDFKIPCG